MSQQGMKNLEHLYIRKTNDRIGEIKDRFLWWGTATVSDVAVAETREHIAPREAMRLHYKPAPGGHQWGEPWGTAWFRVRLHIPAAFKGQTVGFRFKTDGECIIFRDGEPVQALDHGRDTYLLTRRAAGGERIELYVEAGANAAFGAFNKRTMRLPEIAALNRDVWDAYWDLSVLADMIDPKADVDWRGRTRRAMDEGDTRRARIVYAISRAVDLFDYGSPAPAELSRQARAVRRMLEPIFACKAAPSAQTIACLGHAHIDVAWLWPLAETVRKCGRTFSNVLELMRDYPEFKFCQSQPELYEYTRDRYPSLYRQIRRRVREGRWLPTGCMWVEADCNVTSGESLVRQVLFGTRFFKKEFNHDVVCLWLPDVFGYSAALPQILKRSGIPYFLTQKISWSQFSSFPYSSFHWEGIDGSKVLAHFPPADGYNSQLGAHQMLTAARDYREKDRSSIQAVPFGFGDGGGGPTREMLERLKRYGDLEGMPKLQAMSPRDFFTRLERESADLPKWVGELYLEFHRGTYTTQAYNKRFNRMGELYLREAEMFSALELALGGRYDQAALNAAWKLLLLNQFHDIIPGSSIDEVYIDSDRHYEQILSTADTARERALKAMSGRIDTRGKGTPVVAFNSLSWDRTGLVSVALPGLRGGAAYEAVTADGAAVPVDVGNDGVARFAGVVPSVGHRVFHVRPAAAAAVSPFSASRSHMENECLRVDFDVRGCVRRIYDKRHNRDVLAPDQAGNRFLLFEDKMATCGAAWDVDIFYNDKLLIADGELVAVDVLEHGAVRSVVRFTRKLSRSTIRQDVILAAGSPRLDFETTVEWGDEKDVLLKVAFPVAVRADKARYEIQFGSVERPTHWNRPQDFGMFEVAAQRWVDLSESDYGVALLNDCKYGHDVRDNVMRLTLLRAPKNPGRSADVNKTHRFTYALLPHTGGFENGVAHAGYELNVPLQALRVAARGGELPAAASRMSVSWPSVVIDTVKKAEDDDGIIVRLYEAHGARGKGTFETDIPCSRAVEVDLMEREERSLKLTRGRIALSIEPHQIRTLKLIQ